MLEDNIRNCGGNQLSESEHPKACCDWRSCNGCQNSFPWKIRQKKTLYHASYLLFLLSFTQGSLQPFQVTFQVAELILQHLLAGTHVSSFISRIWLSRSIFDYLGQALLSIQQVLLFLMKRWESSVHPMERLLKLLPLMAANFLLQEMQDFASSAEFSKIPLTYLFL